MPKCIVLNCKNYTGKSRTNDLRFKGFPKDRITNKRWRKLCGRTETVPASALVCEEHFTDEQREHYKNCKKISGLREKRCGCRLPDDVDPSLNLPDKEMVKKIREKIQIDRRAQEAFLMKKINNTNVCIPLKKRPVICSGSSAISEEDIEILGKPVDEDNLSVFSGSEHSNDRYDSIDAGVFSLSELCRLCARSGGSMVEIYGTEGQEMKLSDKINLSLPFKVSESDNLPLQVCRSCLPGLEQSHTLATAYLSAQETLNKLLESNRRLFDETAAYPEERTYKGYVDSYSVQEEETVSRSPVLYIDEDATMGSSSRAEEEGTSFHTEQEWPHKEAGGNHKFNCDICKLGFPSSDSVINHCKTVHDKFMCDICFNIFDNHALLSVHLEKGHLFTKFIKNIHKNNNIENTPLNTKSSENLINNSINKTHVCNVCWKVFDNDENFKKHIDESCKQIEEPNLKSKTLASKCVGNLNLSFQGSQILRTLETPEKYPLSRPKFVGQRMDIPCTLDCKICKESIPYHQLKLHYKSAHDSFICMICLDYQHSDIKIFEQHVLKNHKKIAYKFKGTKFSCNYCKKVFTLKFQLECHMIEKHVDITGKFKCLTCNTYFNNCVGYKKHQESHRYECSNCKKLFINLKSLTLHGKYHCKYKNVKNKYRLRSENAPKVEFNIWKYNCTICNKIFNKENEAIAHYGTHILKDKLKNKTGRMYNKSSLFQCRLCDLNCNSQQELTVHTNQIHAFNLTCT